MEERHPIPQNVTGFQFKLIGDMTLRQFAYLAGNAIVAYLFYLSPLYPVLKWPFILFFVFFGILLAFIPFQGRPIDHWIFNFFRAVFSPSQYYFKMEKGPITTPSPQVLPVDQPITPPQTSQKTTIEEKPQPEKPPFQEPLTKPPRFISVEVSGGQTEPSSPAESPTPGPLPLPETELLTIPHAKEPTRRQPLAPAPPQDQQEILNARQELDKLLREKQKLEKELLFLQKQSPSAQIREISAATGPSAGLPNVPQAPNLISGIVKDVRGKILPNILVEVKDKEGNLVRAFKTNKLGQFMAATQLENGAYTIGFEDPQGEFKFDQISLTLEGKIVPPLEIQNLEPKEELRRKIFSI